MEQRSRCANAAVETNAPESLAHSVVSSLWYIV